MSKSKDSHRKKGTTVAIIARGLLVEYYRDNQKELNLFVCVYSLFKGSVQSFRKVGPP